MTKYDLHKFIQILDIQETNRRNNYLKNYIFLLIFLSMNNYTKVSKNNNKKENFSKILK